ncbi:MAG: hypothetical protein R3344_05710 [Acidobacteriota bacterium]|nr:hypothetical protein [Acidobacteriota bacterium]
MSSTIRHRRYRRLATIAVLFIVAIALATPALAHDRRHSRKHRGHHHHGSHRHVSQHHVDAWRGHFAVPARIDHRHVEVYRPYYWTRVYDRRHRHHHSVYRFPVSTPYGVVYEPYAYCDGRLFHDGVQFSYHGRHVAVSVGF